jgi:hypothetical protein
LHVENQTPQSPARIAVAVCLRHLRLINGYYSGGEPKLGQSIKVIELH